MMNKTVFLLLVLAMSSLATPATADEANEASETGTQPTEEDVAPQDAGAKTMSGMSILGNEEAPKSLVIVPWKSSEMGDEIGLSDTLGDGAQPVDKDVFLRELEYYEIRSGE